MAATTCISRQTRARRNISGARSDHELVQLWIESQTSPATQRSYAQVGTRFRSALVSQQIGLKELTLRDLQDYLTTIEGAPSTIAKHIAVLS